MKAIKAEKTIPYFNLDKRHWYPSPHPRMAFYDYPDYRDSDIKGQIKYLKQSQRDSWARKFGDNKIRIPGKPKRKPIKFSQCPDCPKYNQCRELCKEAKAYVFQNLVSPYPVLAATVPEVETDSDGWESIGDSKLDRIFLYSTDIEETNNLFIKGGFENPDVAEVYKSDLIDGFEKIKKTKSRAPAWAWRHSKAVWALYMYFEMRLGIREIGRRVGLSHVRVLELINIHRRVLENHLDKVVRAGVKKSYFYEKYFNQLTVTQIAEKYSVSHQNVSKSIRRTSKKIIKSLRETVANSQRIEGGYLFSHNVQNFSLTAKKNI